ncbi:hypothetical protein GH740_10000 [Microbacterium sp. SYP-A9085]|uniref:hypothetical protein n=1 Tax=Microbacterium sp. SYP-A9085 TaxID=2664454 RepID=UPI00129AD18F|nr:hypothetical protein [Microbacterium sp. SYP-A9085]MRH29644.1 hypothetical protein [Microbacterium sp. SYP-A9085]
MDLSQWRFVVLTRSRVAATGRTSLSWNRALAEGGVDLGYDGLADAIRSAAAAELGGGFTQG